MFYCYGAKAQLSDSIILEDIVISSIDKSVSNAQVKLEIDSLTLQVVPRLDQYLYQVPGIEMQTGTLNTNRINIRGIGSRSPFATTALRAYLDHIPLTDGSGETSLEDINLSAIKDVSVIKGPHQPAFGSSLGGSILFRTPRSMDFNGSNINYELNLGSYGLLRNNLNITNNTTKSFSFINLEQFSSDGFRENNNYEKYAGSLLHKVFLKNGFFTAFASVVDLRAQIPSSINETDFRENPRKAAFNWNNVNGYEDYTRFGLGLNYQTEISKNNTVNISAFGNSFSSYEVRPFNILDDSKNTLGNRLVWNRSGKVNVLMGSEIFYETYQWGTYAVEEAGKQGSRLTDNESQSLVINAFTDWNGTINKYWFWNMGASLNLTRYKYMSSNFVNPSRKTFPLQLNPTASLIFIPYKNLRFSLKGGRGIFYPGIDTSLDEEGLFNEDIKPERGWNFELSTEYLKRQSHYNINVFYLRVSDILINRRDENDAVILLNAGSTRHIGIELSYGTEAKLNDNWRLKTSVAFSFGSYRFTDFTLDNNTDFTGNKLTGVASDKGQFYVGLIRNNLKISSSLRYVGEIPIDDGNTTFADRYLIQGLALNYHPSILGNKIGIKASIDNIWNTKYASMVAVNARAFGNNLPRFFYPGMDRNYQFAITFTP